MRKLLVLSLALSPCFVLPAFADPVITVSPFLAANVFGSPSYATQATNAVYAQMHGLTTYGSGPSQYTVQSNATSAQGVVTSFNSYMGVADPTGAYANELGNRFSFAIDIIGNGSQFSISQLTFAESSTDPGGSFNGVGHTAGFYNYSQNYEGVLAGPDGKLGTADDIFITSGSNTQLVDALYGVGSGASFAADCTGCTTTAQRQAAIDAVAAYPGTPFSITGTYGLSGTNDTGSAKFNISAPGLAATPEPSSLMLMGTGVASIAGIVRRRYLKK